MGLEIDFIGLFLGLILMGLLTLVPITVLGIGIREISLIYIFNLYHLSSEKAVAFSLIIFFIQILSIIPGLYWFNKNPINFKKLDKGTNSPS